LFFRALKEKKEDLGNRLPKSQKKDLLSSSIAPSGSSNENLTEGGSATISILEQSVNLIEADELLHRIVTEIELAILFRDFCHKHYNNENLSFWLEVEDLKVEAKDNPSKLSGLVNEIYEKYFTPGSSYELNIESKEKIKLQNSISNPFEDIFDGIQKSIWNLMISDVVPKFMQSKEYVEFKASSLERKTDDSNRKKLSSEWIDNVEQRTTMFFLNTYNMHHNQQQSDINSNGESKRLAMKEIDLQETKNDEQTSADNVRFEPNLVHCTVHEKQYEFLNTIKRTQKIKVVKKPIEGTSLRSGTLITISAKRQINDKPGIHRIELEKPLEDAVSACSQLHLLEEMLTQRDHNLKQDISDL